MFTGLFLYFLEISPASWKGKNEKYQTYFQLWMRGYEGQRVRLFVRLQINVNQNKKHYFFFQVVCVYLAQPSKISYFRKTLCVITNKEINFDLEVAHPRSGSSSTWFLIELEFWRENRSSKGENLQQTQPTYVVDAGISIRTTLVAGDCSHHCVNPAHCL